MIKRIIVEKKIDTVIFGGDMYENPKEISSKVLSIVSHIISEMGILCNQIFLIGNHDTIDKTKLDIDTDKNNIQLRTSTIFPFNMFDGVSVVDECSVLILNDEKLLIFLVPYIINPLANIEEKVRKYLFNGYSDYKKILFGHIDLQDLNYVQSDIKNIQNRVGVIPSKKNLLDDFKFDLVILGHIHEKELYTVDQSLPIRDFTIDDINKLDRKLLFSGSIRNQNYNNDTMNKGLYILDTDNLQLEYIDNPYTCYYRKIDSLSDLKKYITANSKEILSKTNLMFYYRNIKDIENINKIRHYFHEIRLREIPKTNTIEIDEEYNNKVENYSKNYEHIDVVNILKFIKEYSNIDPNDTYYDTIFESIKNYSDS
jgi:DNA repair exonuclease SbcCD nuclease subunit